jgi:hypothetical protein
MKNNNCECGGELEIDCTCKTRLSTDCITLKEDLVCSNVLKSQTLTEALKLLDAYICERFESLENFFDLINVGSGSQIYKGISNIGKKQLRTLVNSNLITITQGTDTITIAVDETNLIPFIKANQKTYSATNLGIGSEVYKSTTIVGDNTQLNFRKIKSSNASVNISQGTDDIDITVSASVVPDGSETKINAGTNVTKTGTGTIANPYVISSVDTNTTYSAGTGISLVGTTFNNTSPDQTVILSQGGATIVTGTYPNFVISSADTNTTYSAGSGLSLTGTVFAVENLQKVITYPTDFTGTNYTLTNADYNFEIIIANGATNVSITVPSGLTSKIGVGFTQKGTGDVTYVASGTIINNPIGLKIKGQYYQTYLSQELSTNNYFLGGNTKI